MKKMKTGDIVSFGLLVGVDIDVDGSIYSVEVSQVLKVAKRDRS